MALGWLCAANHSFLARTLFRHREAPGLLSVAFKQTVAQELGLPEPPKRPLIPHARYIKEQFEENMKQFPTLSIQEVFKKTLDVWKSLSSLEKSKWTQAYGREKEIYDANYKAYMEKLSSSQVQDIRKLQKKRSEDKIKRQVRREKKKESELLGKPKYQGNAFFQYVSSLDRGKANSKEFMTAAATNWHKLPEETQKVYRDKAKKMREEYQQQLLQWENKMVKQGRIDLVRSTQLGGELQNTLRGHKQKN